MKNLIIFLAAASLGGFFMPAHSDSTFLQNGTFPMRCTIAENGMQELVEIAATRYGEVPKLVGKMGPGLFILTYNYNEEKPSWSVIITKPGEACFFASGTLLSDVPKELTKELPKKDKAEM
jgi:hypothetical protein